MTNEKYFLGGVILLLLVGLVVGWKYVGGTLEPGLFAPTTKLVTQPSTTLPAPPTEIRLIPRQPMTRGDAAKVKETVLAPELDQLLAKEEETLKILAAGETIVDAVRSANARDRDISLAEITRLDTEWIASKTATPFIQQFMNNTAAFALLAFQKTHPRFKEIFIADAYGLNVGETNKTSDYYQADEAWWVNSMNGGTGKVFHGQIEFDQSAQTEAISIYVPIIDLSTLSAIGVLKGVLDLSVLKATL